MRQTWDQGNEVSPEHQRPRSQGPVKVISGVKYEGQNIWIKMMMVINSLMLWKISLYGNGGLCNWAPGLENLANHNAAIRDQET